MPCPRPKGTARRLEPHQAKREVGSSRQGTQRRSDIGSASPAQEADDEVSKACEHLRSVALSHAAAILVKGHIPDPVQSVLDGPMAPGEAQEFVGRGALLASAGDSADDLAASLAGRDLLGDSFDLEDLLAVGEVQVVVELVAGPDSAGLDATVTFFNRLVLRGE